METGESVMELLRTRLTRTFALTRDLVVGLEAADLHLDLPDLPSNRISAQLWCVVGARESYAKAIESGAWVGFGCTLSDPANKPAVLAALETTERRLAEIEFRTLNTGQLQLAFDLLEHEVQHHGQLIRFVYAHSLRFPPSWNQRYSV